MKSRLDTLFSQEGVTRAPDGKAADYLFHLRDMGLDAEAEERLSYMAKEMEEELLAEQARASEKVSPKFARAVYRALLSRFPESSERSVWEGKFKEVT